MAVGAERTAVLGSVRSSLEQGYLVVDLIGGGKEGVARVAPPPRGGGDSLLLPGGELAGRHVLRRERGAPAF